VFDLTEEPIDAAVLQRRVAGPGNGAVVVFLGTVRDRTDERRVTHLEYEAYAPMAVRQMEGIGAAVRDRHGLSALACRHRLGRLEPGDTAVVVAASAPHRRAALTAVEDFIARLKEEVPIWKKEHFEDGAVWVGTPDDPQGRTSGPGARP
jgi:molybdopterin synthase catalytic subunit